MESAKYGCFGRILSGSFHITLMISLKVDKMGIFKPFYPFFMQNVLYQKGRTFGISWQCFLIKSLYHGWSGATWMQFFQMMRILVETIQRQDLLIAWIMLTTNWIDAGYQGSRFTWCNNYEGAHCIRARLDRCLVNSAWSGAFPYWVVQHLSRALSDHAPFLVTYKESMNMEPRRLRTFFLHLTELNSIFRYRYCRFYVVRMGLRKTRLLSS